MAITPSDQDNNSTYGSGDITAELNVSSGDLIVVIIGTMTASIYCDNVYDDDGNSYTVLDVISYSSGHSLVFAYCLSANSNNSALGITAEFTAGSARKNIIARSATPDGGETVSLDVSMEGGSSWEASPWETGTDDTTGTDEYCIAGVQSGNTVTYSNHEIPGGTAATELTSPGYNLGAWERVLSATASGLYAEVDPSGSGNYGMGLLCFKSVAGGAALTKAINESVGLIETISKRMSMKRLVFATEGLQENISAYRALKRYFSETIELVESLLTKSTMKRILSEMVSISESVLKTRMISRFISETIEIIESISTHVSSLIKKFINESVNIVESIGTQISALLKKFINEVIGLSESTSHSISAALIKIISEVLEISEVLIKKSTIKKIISESIGLIESLLSKRTLKRIISESIDLVENIRPVRTIVRKLSSTLSIIETILRRRLLIQIISESVSIVESISSSLAVAYEIIKGELRRVFTFDNAKRVFHKDTLKRIFTKDTDKREL